MEILSGKKRRRETLGRLGLLAVLGVVCVAGARGQPSEYQVKAAFLYNFASFVEWPSKSFNGPNDPIVICILGDNPFGDALAWAIRGKVSAGRPFTVRPMPDVPSKSNCQILFVDSTGRKRFRAMVESLKASHTLTVGDGAGFIDDGGVIAFKLEDGRIRFEINVEAALQAQLTISSKLLSLARVVRK